MELDGNGWVDCGCGHRHWGLHGAAGLFLTVDDHLLLQLRPGWAHQGGTWAIPGGARDSHETVVSAALREAHEETALDPGQVTVTGVHRLQHPDWRYDTVLATAATRLPVVEQAESVRLQWTAVTDLGDVDLHPGLREALPTLLLPPLRLVVDAANVVGSTPDGWWRDRPAATQRLIQRLQDVVGRPIAWEGRQHLVTHLEVVVQGAARAVSDPGLDSLIHLVRAQGHGDDTIVERARSVSGVVVSSDRGLRARVPRSVSAGTLLKVIEQ
jgi:8-oxo-dGTP diphosphatase